MRQRRARDEQGTEQVDADDLGHVPARKLVETAYLDDAGIVDDAIDVAERRDGATHGSFGSAGISDVGVNEERVGVGASQPPRSRSPSCFHTLRYGDAKPDFHERLGGGESYPASAARDQDCLSSASHRTGRSRT